MSSASQTALLRHMRFVLNGMVTLKALGGTKWTPSCYRGWTETCHSIKSMKVMAFGWLQERRLHVLLMIMLM